MVGADGRATPQEDLRGVMGEHQRGTLLVSLVDASMIVHAIPVASSLL